MQTVNIPKAFYDDHQERELPTPRLISELSSTYLIDRDDPAFAELVNDAEHYAKDGCDCGFGLKMAARALLRRVQS